MYLFLIFDILLLLGGIMEELVRYNLKNRVATRFCRKLKIFSVDFHIIKVNNEFTEISVCYNGRNVKRAFEEYLQKLVSE